MLLFIVMIPRLRGNLMLIMVYPRFGFCDHLSVSSITSTYVLNVLMAQWGSETGFGRGGRAMDDGGPPPVIAEA